MRENKVECLSGSQGNLLGSICGLHDYYNQQISELFVKIRDWLIAHEAGFVYVAGGCASQAFFLLRRF